MREIPRTALDAVIGDDSRVAAVLVSVPEEHHVEVVVRGVTVVRRSGRELAVTAHLYLLEGDTYVEQGCAGGVSLDDGDFRPGLVYETSPRPVDEDESEWLVPRIEVSFGPGGAVASRVLLRPADASDEITDGPL